MKKLFPLLTILFLIYWGCEDTKIEDNIPTGVTLWGVDYSIENTTELDLNSRVITGSIPPEIGNLTNLTSLYLYDNQLTGSIPSEVGNLTKPTGLDLSGNELTDSYPQK